MGTEARREPLRVNPPGAVRYLGAGQGRQRGGEQTWERHQDQARGVGCRDEQKNLASGGCGWCLVGRSSSLGEEVGSGCEREVRRQQNSTDGGAVVRWKDQERSING